MLNKDEVLQKMSERNFSVLFYGKTNKNDTSNILFVKKDKLAISCYVDLDEDTFTFSYNIPNSINQIKTPKCGSFMNDNHFDKIYSKLKDHAQILDEIYRED